MKRLWLVFLLAATSQAAAPMIGNTDVYVKATVHEERYAERFFMPTDGTIETLSIYHQGGAGQMLLGVYLGTSAPGVRIGTTVQAPIVATEGWQTVALTQPVWVPGGTPIWLAWVFEDNPGVRSERVASASVVSDQGWEAGMPSSFGTGTPSDRACSVYATYIRDAHPVINEVFPRNDSFSESSFLDDDWTKQGWVEIYNPYDHPIHLGDYYLSNAEEDLQRWAFPEVLLGPEQALRVWCSGKDRTDPERELHTSFSLMGSESVFLSYAALDRTIDSVSEIEIPVDHSYGRYPDGGDQWCFFTHPTPGASNTETMESCKRFVIDQRHVSLTVGRRLQLTVTPPDETVVWSSSNPLVWVDPDGGLLAIQDALRDKAQATITARSLNGECLDTCQVTIVNWTANVSELDVVATPYASYILGSEADRVFYTIGRDLYATSDGFLTSEFLSTLPESMDIPKMLVTPFGYFVQCSESIFKSDDLVNWSPTVAMDMKGMHHGLAYYWDAVLETGYLYAGEYSCDHSERHAVRRGVFPPEGPETWETVLEFASIDEWLDDSSRLDVARHIHTVAVDPYTGDVWVGTGDWNEHSRLLYSNDHGENFRVVGMGRQAYRTLSIWFTERYVYWSMDTWDDQCCWRIPRSQVTEYGFWPCMTPELGSGQTVPGVSYYVTASETETHFPAPVGHIYRETEIRPLDSRNRARALDDPAYDYKEKVAELRNSSLWYHLWTYNGPRTPVLILGQSAEGAHRDRRGRVFGFKEGPDGSVDVQELLSVSSKNPDEYDGNTMYVQLEPMAQDSLGYIYFTGRSTYHRSYKTTLEWMDDPLQP